MEAPDPVDNFQGAFGRMCALAAEAMADDASRDSVRLALQGKGANIRLRHIREQVRIVRAAFQEAKAALIAGGLREPAAVKLLLVRARNSRAAVEGEWGHDNRDTWGRQSIPIVEVLP